MCVYVHAKWWDFFKRTFAFCILEVAKNYDFAFCILEVAKMATESLIKEGEEKKKKKKLYLAPLPCFL